MGKPMRIGVVLACLAGCTGKPVSYVLTVEIEGEGTVTILNTEVGTLVCEPDCEEKLDGYENFQGWALSAVPADGWVFDRWEDGGRSDACVPGATFTPNLSLDGGDYRCHATFLPCDATDPVDLGADPKGDPTLDILCVHTGMDRDGAPWVEVYMDGPWAPPEVYSWYTTVTVSDATGPVGSYTEQLHDGVRETIVDGVLEGSVFDPNPASAGYLLTMPSAIAEQIESLTVESGIEKTTNPADFRMDGPVAVDPFDTTNRDPVKN